MARTTQNRASEVVESLSSPGRGSRCRYVVVHEDISAAPGRRRILPDPVRRFRIVLRADIGQPDRPRWRVGPSAHILTENSLPSIEVLAEIGEDPEAVVADANPNVGKWTGRNGVERRYERQPGLAWFRADDQVSAPREKCEQIFSSALEKELVMAAWNVERVRPVKNPGAELVLRNERGFQAGLCELSCNPSGCHSDGTCEHCR